MILTVRYKLWLLALYISFSQLICADPLINQRERARLRQNEKYNVSSSVIKMTSRISLNGTVGLKQFSYLQKHPRNFDVVFVVGPEKTIVKAPSLVLTSASPVFEHELETRWKNAVLKESEGISLPDLDPVVFKLFVELTILDSWSVDALKALELPSNQLLHLISICHKFKMTIALKNLNELANDFLSDFAQHVKPEEFLLLSQTQLESILASDDLAINETDVYTYAIRWAEEQCRMRAQEKTGQNMRQALGNALYKIRFPLMTLNEFVVVIQRKGLLSKEEIAQIVHFIVTAEKSRVGHDITSLQFNTLKREPGQKRDPSIRLDLLKGLTVSDSPAGICDGSTKQLWLHANHTIAINGVGFLGPSAGDGFFDVKIEFKFRRSFAVWETLATVKSRLLAKQRELFNIVIDPPVICNATHVNNGFDADGNPYYGIFYSIKGNNTQTSLRTKLNFNAESDGIGFFIYSPNAQIAEIKFRRG